MNRKVIIWACRGKEFSRVRGHRSIGVRSMDWEWTLVTWRDLHWCVKLMVLSWKTSSNSSCCLFGSESWAFNEVPWWIGQILRHIRSELPFWFFFFGFFFGEFLVIFLLFFHFDAIFLFWFSFPMEKLKFLLSFFLLDFQSFFLGVLSSLLLQWYLPFFFGLDGLFILNLKVRMFKDLGYFRTVLGINS